MLDKVIKYLSQRKDRLKEKEELVKRINVRENYFKDLSDASLKRRIGEYREGKYLTAPYNEQMKILVDVFSIVRRHIHHRRIYRGNADRGRKDTCCHLSCRL